MVFQTVHIHQGHNQAATTQKSIITGDEIAIILFSSAINLIVKSAEKKCKGPAMRSGVRQSLVKHDLAIASTGTDQTRWDIRRT